MQVTKVYGVNNMVQQDSRGERFESRRQKLRQILIKLGADAILVSDEINVTYMTGFTGDSSYYILTMQKEFLVSDTRYTTQIDEECGAIEKVIRDSSGTTLGLLCETLGSLRSKNVACETHVLSKRNYDVIASDSNCNLLDGQEAIESLRAIKDDYEVGEIRNSIELAEKAFVNVRERLRGEQTEADIAHLIEHEIRLLGGDRCAFEPIVGVGARAALPHAVKTTRAIQTAPFVLVDWGAKAGQYMSDITRMIITGNVPDRFCEIFEVVLKAQQCAINQIRPGESIRSVDAAARGTIEDAGHGKNFGHGLGHGFGMRIHETPFISPRGEGVLEEGMVVTVEPGIYYPEWGGVRIEDDVLVTSDGNQVLTSLPKSIEESRVQLN